jgi:hypothetical protein
MSTAALSLARQYFAVATAGGKAFFAGGFANDGTLGVHGIGHPDAGFRSSVVDIYDQASGKWTVEHLSTNRHGELVFVEVIGSFGLEKCCWDSRCC